MARKARSGTRRAAIGACTTSPALATGAAAAAGDWGGVRAALLVDQDSVVRHPAAAGLHGTEPPRGRGDAGPTPARPQDSGLPLARVMVVDDDPGIRAALAAAPEDEGYAAATAADGEAALRQLRADEAAGGLPPHAIVLDMRMPVLDGEGFIGAYRRVSARRSPVLALTASRALAAAAARTAGADDVLLKPFDLEELLARVAELVGRAPGRH